MTKAMTLYQIFDNGEDMLLTGNREEANKTIVKILKDKMVPFDKDAPINAELKDQLNLKTGDYEDYVDKTETGMIPDLRIEDYQLDLETGKTVRVTPVSVIRGTEAITIK